MRFRFYIFMIFSVFSFAKDGEISIIMGGDALLHTAVYKDAEYKCAKDFIESKNSTENKDSKNTTDSKNKKDSINSKNSIDSKNTKDSANIANSKNQKNSKVSKSSIKINGVYNIYNLQDSINNRFNNLTEQNKSLCYDFSAMFALIKPTISGYDLAFYNQESILGGTALGLSSYPTFNSPQEFGDTMLKTGFNLISLANNHTLDRGEAAIKESLKYWQNKNALATGSFESAKEREQQQTKIFKKNSITYAMLAYTYGTNGIALPQGKEHLVNVYNKEMLARDIAVLRPKVDLLIVSMHWGAEYVFAPTKEQVELAEFLSAQGVDIVIGTHPHVVQPIDMIGDTLVIYSLGNMLSAQKGVARKIGAFVSVKVQKNPTTKRVSLKEVKSDLIYTYHNDKNSDFRIYPFTYLNDSMLPNYRELYKQYSDILLQKDSKHLIKMGIF